MTVASCQSLSGNPPLKAYTEPVEVVFLHAPSIRELVDGFSPPT